MTLFEATGGTSVTDEALRKMRDTVYENPISDESWEKIRKNWINDVRWLQTEYNKVRQNATSRH